MQPQAQMTFDDYSLRCQGTFVFETIPAVLQQWDLLKGTVSKLSKINLCCHDIISVDSSFMALVIDIKRFCLLHNVRLKLTGLSKDKEDFLSAYGLDPVLSD